MIQRYFKPTQIILTKLRSKSGAVLVTALTSIPVLLAFAGLSIDMGRVYQSRHVIQRALDSASLAAIDMYTIAGEDQALDSSSRMGTFNLRRGGIQSGRVETHYEINADNVLTAVATPRDVKYRTLFLHLLPSIERMVPINNLISRAESDQANIALVLDASSSMSWKMPTSYVPEFGAQRKLEKEFAVKFAARELIQLLRPNKDRLSVIMFTDRGVILRPMGTFTNNQELHRILNEEYFGSSWGSTNIDEGIAMGRVELDKINQTDYSHAYKSYLILFSDGVANYSTAAFSNPRSVPPPTTTTAWYPVPPTTDPAITHPKASYYEGLDYVYTIANDATKLVFPRKMPANSIQFKEWGMTCMDPPPYTPVEGDLYATYRCLENFGSYDSTLDLHFDLITTVHTYYDGQNPMIEKYKRIPVHRTIIEARKVSEPAQTNAKIYTVDFSYGYKEQCYANGYGGTLCFDCTDSPYYCPGTLLRTAANDPAAGSDFQYNEIHAYCSHPVSEPPTNYLSNHNTGKNIEATNSEELKAAFTFIGQEITRVKLVE
jgi:hypothetical protein